MRYGKKGFSRRSLGLLFLIMRKVFGPFNFNMPRMESCAGTAGMAESWITKLMLVQTNLPNLRPMLNFYFALYQILYIF